MSSKVLNSLGQLVRCVPPMSPLLVAASPVIGEVFGAAGAGVIDMATDLPPNLTQLANDAQHDPEAAKRFLTAVYEVLREIAHKEMDRRPAAGESATEVAHEVAIDFLMPASPTTFVDGHHVLGGLVTRITHKFVDLARRRRRKKRGGGVAHVSTDSPAALGVSARGGDGAEKAAVEEAFTRLKDRHPNAYQTLKLRNAGHAVREVADQLDVSPKTVIRWNAFGIAFLYGQLGEDPPTVQRVSP